EELKSRIQTKPFAAHLISLDVEFKEASAYSLDLLVISSYKGEAAGDYFAIGRFYQSTIVELCTANNWGIPFQNITVHMENPQ
ncbi:MAG: hypothetical protein R3240_08110, partial [Gammaproteobacteria bacterium]|nr:hypothetical protein [Gammaproteobacteria bacterium]